MPFFRKQSRSSAEKAKSKKNQKDSSKKKRKGGFLKKKKTPLTHCEDASRASSTQPQPRWNKIETDFTGLQPTTKGNVKAPGKMKTHKEVSDKNWAAFQKNVNSRLSLRNNQENHGFPKMQAIQEDAEMELRRQQSAVGETRNENEPSGPVDMDDYFDEPDFSGMPSFLDQEEKQIKDDSASPDEKSYADDFTCEMTYSQSVASEVDAEEAVAPEEANQEMEVENQQLESSVEEKRPVLEMEEVDKESPDEPEELGDSKPSVSAYVSLNRIPKSDLTYEFTTSSSKDSSQRSEWKPKPDMMSPLGATSQEIDALNLFLSVVGPDFNGHKLSSEERKAIYERARLVGLNKVLVDKFLDQLAGIVTVEEASTLSDLSPCSSYSTTSRSLRISKSEFSDQTSSTGFSGESENSDSIRYKYLPRTAESPHANQNYGCKGIFEEFLWNNPKKGRTDIFQTGKGILESIGAVVSGEDESIPGEV